jgi:hypothetical protein
MSDLRIGCKPPMRARNRLVENRGRSKHENYRVSEKVRHKMEENVLLFHEMYRKGG